MLILPRLTDEFEIREEMKRCNSFSPTPPSFSWAPWIGLNNGHAWDTKAGGVRALVPGTQTPSIQSTFHHSNKRCRAKKPWHPLSLTKAVSSNIWGYWHWKEPLSLLWDCQLWDVSAGGGSCQPNQAAQLLSWGPAFWPSPGPRSLDTQGTPTRPRPFFGHRWEWEAEHIAEISGDPSPFALGRWLETVTRAKLVFPDRHQMVLTHDVASAVWSVCVCVCWWVAGWLLCVMDMLLKSYNMGRPSVCHYSRPVLSLGGSLAYAKQPRQHRLLSF